MNHAQFVKEMNYFLAGCRTASLATVDERGHPHAVNLWYAQDSLGRLYYVSSLESAHSRHILRDPAVALTVYGETDDPMKIHGLQIHGICTPIAPPPEGNRADWELAWQCFASKYPFVQEQETFKVAVEAQCFFRITPTWARWLDTRKGFGFKSERFLVQPKSKSISKRSTATTGAKSKTSSLSRRKKAAASSLKAKPAQRTSKRKK